MSGKKVYYVSFVANEEFHSTVRVVSESGKKPTKTQVNPLVRDHIRNDWGEPFDFRIEDIGLIEDKINSMQLVGSVNKAKDTPKCIQQAEVVSERVTSELANEVSRLLNTGAIDPENHNPNSVVMVALENITSRFKNESCSDYKNLKHF